MSKAQPLYTIARIGGQSSQWTELLNLISALTGAVERESASGTTKRPSDSGRGESKLVALLLPYLTRLQERERALESLALQLALKADAFNQLSFGIVIAGRCTGIRFTNRTAEQIAAARDGLRLCRGRLVADHPEDNSALAEAQERSFAAHAGGLSARATPVAVRRHLCQRPYRVDVVPLVTSDVASRQTLPNSDPAILVTICNPSAASAPTVDFLMKTYRLTRTEASLALEIAKGTALKEAAEKLGASEQTARWHLKNVLTKTDSRRQSQLVSAVMSMASPHRSHCETGDD